MFDWYLSIVDKFLDFFGMVFEWLLKPISDEGTNRALTKRNLEANLRRAGVAPMLPYRIYREVEGVGIYTGEGDFDSNKKYKGDRHGFILKIEGSAFPNDQMQEQVNAFLKKINKKGVVVNFLSMASQNIEPQIQEFERFHPCNVNVEGITFLKKLISNRASMLRRWTRESMFGKTGGDMRIKEFVSLVSVLFPEGVDINEVVSEYGKLKSSLGMRSRSFSADELVTVLREFFHNEKDPEDWMHGKDDLMSINKQVTAGGLKISLDTENPRINYQMNDGTHVAVLVTKKFPRRISFSGFNSLFYDRTEVKGLPPIGSPFMSSLTLVYNDEEEVKKKAISKLGHDQEQLSAMSAKKMKRKPGLKDRLKETQDGLRAINDGERILEGMFNIIIFDTDEKAVERSIDGITSSFNEEGWELVQETFNHVAFNQTIYSLPLQFRQEAFDYLDRFDMLYRGNFSGIAPIIGDTKGFWKNYHIPYFSSTGQLQWFDPYASDTNYSIATAGDSGSGKSYTFADFATLNLAAGYIVRIIDSLPSYKRMTNMIGGQYEDFTGFEICANFFTNLLPAMDENGDIIYETIEGINYKVIDENEIQTLIPILGMLAKVDIKSIKSENVESGISAGILYSVFEDAIRKSWRRRGNEAGMKEIYEAISERAEKEKKAGNTKAFELIYGVSIAFEPYGVEGGSGYSFFNGVNNIEMTYDLATFELTNLESRGILYEVFLMLLANKIVNEFFEDKARPKCLIIDEFWRYKELDIVLKFIEELARKARKASAFIVPITQAITDYVSSVGMENVANSCAFKWILQQDPSVIEKAKEKNSLPYSRFITNQIGKIHNNPPQFGEFAIMNGSASLFTRLKTDRISHWLYTTHPSDNKKMASVSREFNITELEAALFCAFKDTFEHASDEEALVHATTKEDDNWERYREKEGERNKKIAGLIKRTALTEYENIELKKFTLKSISNQDASEILLVTPFLRFGIDELLSPEEYRFILEESPYVVDFLNASTERVLGIYTAGRWDTIIIDISTKGFFQSENLDLLLQVLSESKKTFLLKVNFSEIDSVETESLSGILSKFEKFNIGLVLDNPNAYIPVALMVSDAVKYVVIDEDNVKNLEEKDKWAFLLMKEKQIGIIIKSSREIHVVPETLDSCETVLSCVTR